MSYSSMIQMIERDKVIERDKKQVDEARKNLMEKGMTAKIALKKIKRTIAKAVKEKLN